MRIGLNLLHARPAIGGVWNYMENVLKALSAIEDDCCFLAYCTPDSAALVPDDNRFKIRMRKKQFPHPLARILYEQTILPLRALRDGADCLHWFANNVSFSGAVPSVVTVHDYMFLDRPADMNLLKRVYLRRMAEMVSWRAASLAAISGTTARVIQHHFGVPDDRITIISTPIDTGRFHPAEPREAAEFRARIGLPERFWVYVAHTYPHKNHARLLEAYCALRRQGGEVWPLVLRGDDPGDGYDLKSAIAEMGLSDSVRWLPRLTFDEMRLLYASASALIFPSLYEGCGLPVLEAMACGCPVAASDIPTTQEFIGEAALTFDPLSVDAIANAMREFAFDEERRRECAARGLERVKLYSSGIVARNLMGVYRSVAAAGKPAKSRGPQK
jgi:glycosyltransferase involved in cell wall biosynthesis